MEGHDEDEDDDHDHVDGRVFIAYEDAEGNLRVMDDMAEGGEVMMEELNDSVIQRGRSAVREYLTCKKNAAAHELYKFLCIIIVSLACIVCIGMDIERTFFVSILTFNMGLVADSPLNTRNLQTPTTTTTTTSTPTPTK